MMAYGAIYVLTNSVNGKQYVGQTTDRYPMRRLSGHLHNARGAVKSLLYSAMRKYGPDVWACEIIFFAHDKEALDSAERHFIVSINTKVPNGYNLRDGGGAGRHSDESRARMSAAAKAERSTAEARERMRMAAIEAMNRPDVKIKMSVARKEVEARSGMKESRRKMQVAVMKRPGIKELHRAATLAAMSKPGMHEKMSAAMFIALSKPETKAKMSDAAKNRSQSCVQKHIDILMEVHGRPEIRARRRARILGSHWITNGQQSRQLVKGQNLPEGWAYGRK